MKNLKLVFTSIAFFILFAVGISLFYLRDQYHPFELSDAVTVPFSPVALQIVPNEFVIQIKPSDAPHIATVLESFNLEIKSPLLNWIYVGKKDQDKPNIYEDIMDEKAFSSKEILHSLKKHPAILEAHHNFVVTPQEYGLTKPWGLGNDVDSLEIKKWFSKKDIASLAIVDSFYQDGQFGLAHNFPNCTSRVRPSVPYGIQPKHFFPENMAHGEMLLLALGACAQDQDGPKNANLPHFYAVERPSLGHAQSFLAALWASGIDVCQESMVPCPEKSRPIGTPPNADVILLPWGSQAPDLLQISADMISAINQRKKILIAAAGNNNDDGSNFFPASAPGIISVGASTKQKKRAFFSNYGPTVDLLAPGYQIRLELLSLSKKVSGTSVAAAQVAGTVALMKTLFPGLEWKLAEYFLKSSAEPIDCTAYCNLEKYDGGAGCEKICCLSQNHRCNKGILDIKAALMMAKEQKPKRPLIDLNAYYLTMTSETPNKVPLIVSNLGLDAAFVQTQAFSKNLRIEPEQFLLKDRQEIIVSYAERPLLKETSRIDFLITDPENPSLILDTISVYMEYITK